MFRSTRPPLNNQFSVLMVGYYGSGKTSILNRFSRNIYQPQYHMSLTSSSHTRLFSIDNTLSVKLKLIDSLGSGLTKQMVNNGIPPSDALLLVYDLTNQESFYRLDRWMVEMRHIVSQSTLIVLVGTHADQPYKRRVSEREAKEWRQNNNVSIFFEISNKTNENILEMFQQICLKLAFAHRNKSLTYVANPEESLIFQDSMPSHHNNSKIIILEKKLKFKEQECSQLWLDYEDALRKINQLQSYSGMKHDKNDMLASMIIESQTDTDEMEGKIRSLEENIKVLEEYYTSKQLSLEQSTCKKIQALNLKVQELSNEVESLQKEYSKLQNEKQDIQSNLSVVKNDLEDKITQYATLLHQLDRLKQIVDEGTSLIQVDFCPLSGSEFTFNIVQLMHRKFVYLVQLLDEKQNLHQKQESDFKIVQEKFERQIENLFFLKSNLQDQIESYEEQMSFYRAQSVLKGKLQLQVSQLKAKVILMEADFSHKCQWYIETIEQRERTIKVLIENAKHQEDKIAYLREQNEKIFRQLQEKDKIIQKKAALMSRVVGQKVNEINELKGFLEELGNRSSHIVKKYSNGTNNPNEDIIALQEENQKYIDFFEQFLEKTKHRSETMLDYLINVANHLGQMSQTFTNIQAQTQQLQIINYTLEQMPLHEKRQKLAWFKQYIQSQEIDRANLALFADQIEKFMAEIHDWEFKFWQKMRNESSCRVSKVLSLLCFVQGELQENTKSFKIYLQEISSNIESIEGITSYGVQEYIQAFFK